MSKILIKCAKCQKNAETQSNPYEFTHTYPIRDKDGQVYCWYCYKNKSHCEGCQRSVANLKFPGSGNPHYPRVSGYARSCERVMNEVKFYCSSECGQKIAAKEYQNWKEKLSQGWTKCEECVKFWTEYWIDVKSQEGQKWFAEEKNQRGFLKLVEPGQGKLCQDHRKWEESGKQWYEEVKNQAQEEWNNLSYANRLRLVKRERPSDKSCEERAARPEIDALVLSQFISKANHEKYNCPNCDLKNYPSQLPPGGSDNDLLVSSHENNSPADNSEKKGSDQQSQERTLIRENKDNWDHSGLIIGGIIIASLVSLAAILIVKKKNKR